MKRTVIRCLAAVLALAPSAVLADGDPGKAAALLKEADFATRKADCFAGNRIKEGCRDPAVFPAAMAKVDEALKADTSGATLAAVCQLAGSAQGPEFEWLSKNGRVDQVLAWCDAATLSTGKRGQEDNLLNHLASSSTDAERQARAEAAMRALYGVGLKVTRDAAKNEVSIDYGDVDAAKLESYIAEIWVPAHVYGGNSGMKKGQLGSVLLDPERKEKLCAILAARSKDRKASEEWCKIEAVKEAASALVAFRGKAVTYPSGTSDSGLKPDEVVLVGRPDGHWEVALTVAGPAPVDDQFHVDRLNTMVGGWGELRKNREVAGMVARANQVAKQKQAAYQAEEAKRVKQRPLVLFSDASFETWTFPAALRADAPPACEQVHFKAYAPKKDMGYELLLQVDGASCHMRSISADNVPPDTDALTKPTYTHERSDCPEKLAAPGKHEVNAEVWTLKSGVVGKEVRDGVVQDRYMSGMDKKLGSWKVKCVTP